MSRASSDDAAQTILSLQEETAQLREEGQILREVIVQLTKENLALRDDNQDLLAQNAAYLQQISKLQSRIENRNAIARTTDTQNTINDDIYHSPEQTHALSMEKASQEDSSNADRILQIEQLQNNAVELQHRIKILVQQKINIHSLVETLEHELLTGCNTGGSVNTGNNVLPVTMLSSNDIVPCQRNKEEENNPPFDTAKCATAKGSRRICINGLFSNRSPISTGGQIEDGILREESQIPEFDIRQELEGQLYSRTTTVRPSIEQFSLPGGTHPSVDSGNHDRVSWERMKNDQDISGTICRTGVRMAAEVSQAQSLQTTSEQKNSVVEEKRRSSARTGGIGLLPSKKKVESPSAATPISIYIDNKDTMRSPAGDMNISTNLMIMDADDNQLEHFDDRRLFAATSKTIETNNIDNSNLTMWRSRKKNAKTIEETRAKTAAFQLLF